MSVLHKILVEKEKIVCHKSKHGLFQTSKSRNCGGIFHKYYEVKIQLFWICEKGEIYNLVHHFYCVYTNVLGILDRNLLGILGI